LYKLARGLPTLGTSQIPPKEVAFISAGLEHIAMLEHANHPKEPIMHLHPHSTNIRLALQTGQPIPHFPPQMAELEEIQMCEGLEEINVTRTRAEPTPAVWPGDDEGNSKGSG
jgi:hypothetical protein